MVAESYMNLPVIAKVRLPATKSKLGTYDDIYNKWLAKTHDHHVARERADAWQRRQPKEQA